MNISTKFACGSFCLSAVENNLPDTDQNFKELREYLYALTCGKFGCCRKTVLACRETMCVMSLRLTILAVLFSMCTGCYQSEFIKVLEFTYPPGSTDMPIREWATQAWLEHTKTLPTSLSVCTAVFLKSWVADWNTDLILFRLEDKNGIGWARLWMYAGENTTTITAYIGQDKEEVKVAPTESLPMFFPQSWMRVCMSLDMDNCTALHGLLPMESCS